MWGMYEVQPVRDRRMGPATGVGNAKTTGVGIFVRTAALVMLFSIFSESPNALLPLSTYLRRFARRLDSIIVNLKHY